MSVQVATTSPNRMHALNLNLDDSMANTIQLEAMYVSSPPTPPSPVSTSTVDKSTQQANLKWTGVSMMNDNMSSPTEVQTNQHINA